MWLIFSLFLRVGRRPGRGGPLLLVIKELSLLLVGKLLTGIKFNLGQIDSLFIVKYVSYFMSGDLRVSCHF